MHGCTDAQIRFETDAAPPPQSGGSTLLGRGLAAPPPKTRAPAVDPRTKDLSRGFASRRLSPQTGSQRGRQDGTRQRCTPGWDEGAQARAPDHEVGAVALGHVALVDEAGDHVAWRAARHLHVSLTPCSCSFRLQRVEQIYADIELH